MRSRGTDNADRISVSVLDVAIPIPSWAPTTASFHCPDYSAQIVHARPPDGKSNTSEAGLPERRKPAIARHEAANVPPPAKEPEERVESPGRAGSIGLRLAFAEDQRATLPQHFSQMVQRRQLVLGAM